MRLPAPKPHHVRRLPSRADGERGTGGHRYATRGGADVSVTFGFPARDGTAARPVGEGGLGGGAGNMGGAAWTGTRPRAINYGESVAKARQVRSALGGYSESTQARAIRAAALERK
jgi:hypothetical protein